MQDKVVEFAKLDCYEMLEETEKAVSVSIAAHHAFTNNYGVDWRG